MRGSSASRSMILVSHGAGFPGALTRLELLGEELEELEAHARPSAHGVQHARTFRRTHARRFRRLPRRCRRTP